MPRESEFTYELINSYDPWRCNSVKYHPDFNAVAFVLELEDSQDGLVERALGLHHIIVNGVHGGVYRDFRR